jgi:hypothetical protein
MDANTQPLTVTITMLVLMILAMLTLDVSSREEHCHQETNVTSQDVIKQSELSLTRLPVMITTHVPLTPVTLILDASSPLLMLMTTTDVPSTGVTDKLERFSTKILFVMTTTHVPKIAAMLLMDVSTNQPLSTVTITTSALLTDVMQN